MTPFTVCTVCGSLVVWEDTHTAWHNRNATGDETTVFFSDPRHTGEAGDPTLLEILREYLRP